MNEYFEIALRTNGKRLRIRRQLADGRIELAEPDPIARSFSIGLDPINEATRVRLRWVQQRLGWHPNDLKLRVAVEDGYLVARGVDEDALPPGWYRLRLHIEEARTRRQPKTVRLNRDGYGGAIVEIEKDDRQVTPDLTDVDPRVGALLDRSTLDDQVGREWVFDPDWRPARRACVLNLMACLRTKPSLSAPLIESVKAFYHAASDRAYAQVSTNLLPLLEELARRSDRPFDREGRPKAPIHELLLESIPPGERHLFSRDRLTSFRAEGSPSLQIVVAQPEAGGPRAYAEFDLDLGNALQDVVGFLVHLGELLDGKPTNHLDLRKRLVKNPTTARYVYYTIVGQ